MGVKTTYRITSQELIFRGLLPSASDDTKLYNPRIVKYVKEAFFVWGTFDKTIKKLAQDKNLNEQTLTKHINALIDKTMAYKATLFHNPDDHHLSTERVLNKPGLSLYNQRHHLHKATQHKAQDAPRSFLGQASIYNLLYDNGAPLIDAKALKTFALTPLTFRVGEMFWNLDQLFLAFLDQKRCLPSQIDAVNNAIYEHLLYIGELSGLFQSLSSKDAANAAAKTKQQIIKAVRELYAKIPANEKPNHHNGRVAAEKRCIQELKQLYAEKYNKTLNRSTKWFCENIFYI